MQTVMLMIGLILSVLGAIGGILWVKDKFHLHLRERAFWSIFTIQRTARILVVVPTGGRCVDRDSPNCSTSPAPNVITTIEDSMARACVIASLIDHGFNPEIRIHSALTAEERRENLILICGPAGNCVSRDILMRSDIPHHFTFCHSEKGWLIVDGVGKPIYNETDSVQRDYAILTKYPNPWASLGAPRTIYFVAGIEGLGTWGAASVLASHGDLLMSHLKALLQGRSMSWFSALLLVERNETSSPTIGDVQVRAW